MTPDVISTVVIAVVPATLAALVAEATRRHMAGTRFDRHLRQQRP